MTKYPLLRVGDLRARALDAAMTRLAGFVKLYEDARRARAAAEARRLEHDRTAEQIRSNEREVMASGALRASDLAQARAWDMRAAFEAARLEAFVQRAREGESTASKAHTDAQAQVGARRADARVIERDRARWESARRCAAEAKEEEALSESWRRRG